MDYCSTCRRHLNGALVCPGCGAYAPDIAPGVVGGSTVPAPATAADPAGDPAALPDDLPPEAPAAAAAGHAGTGRAARRRQQVRWKKTQRRALVATAVAFVGGGLTLASMDRSGGDRAQAASAPDLRGMGGAELPADQYGGPADPAPSPDRTTRSPKAGDEHERRDETARTPATPSRTQPESAASPQTAEPPSRPRAAATDTGARAEADVDTGAGSASGSVSGSAPGSASGFGDSDTATRPASPPPAADDGADDGAGSGSGTEQGGNTPSAPSATSPDSDRLCLLVICLG
ncbi:hypothetical protein ACI2LV_23510 [Streptomyces fungicidicus]|uniref:SCO2400 family protein n=1 Tax=Streptomyces fungicidicus TaxID=68203 RepID=UPI00384E1719